MFGFYDSFSFLLSDRVFYDIFDAYDFNIALIAALWCVRSNDTQYSFGYDYDLVGVCIGFGFESPVSSLKRHKD